ncbi:hypothetical protein M9H77_22546 [Catharanthus roseus]|uniref:Uncharacterized protein n=1 Tax=Catharanthus roseus TaxID=4058 RepID=A0ACC0AQH4_CATRO|nr:hypothetical protein M9H77_22546 [Catharanthus roseus]
MALTKSPGPNGFHALFLSTRLEYNGTGYIEDYFGCFKWRNETTEGGAIVLHHIRESGFLCLEIDLRGERGVIRGVEIEGGHGAFTVKSAYHVEVKFMEDRGEAQRWGLLEVANGLKHTCDQGS